MKRFIFLMLVVFLAGGIAYSQSDKNKKKANSPQEKVTVNRKYDENGNLISFDSTRVYSWSSDSTLTGDETGIDLSDFFHSQGGGFFAPDSSFMGDWGMGDEEMHDFFENFMNRFPDSINQQFYSYRNDSCFQFHLDSLQALQLNGQNSMPGLRWNVPDSVRDKFFTEPGMFFPNDSVWEKHRELIKKHMDEMEKMQQEIFQF